MPDFIPCSEISLYSNALHILCDQAENPSSRSLVPSPAAISYMEEPIYSDQLSVVFFFGHSELTKDFEEHTETVKVKYLTY